MSGKAWMFTLFTTALLITGHVHYAQSECYDGDLLLHLEEELLEDHWFQIKKFSDSEEHRLLTVINTLCSTWIKNLEKINVPCNKEYSKFQVVKTFEGMLNTSFKPEYASKTLCEKYNCTDGYEIQYVNKTEFGRMYEKTCNKSISGLTCPSKSMPSSTSATSTTSTDSTRMPSSTSATTSTDSTCTPPSTSTNSTTPPVCTCTPPSISATTSTGSTRTPPSISATTSTGSTRMSPSTSATTSTDSTRTPPSISATTSTESTRMPSSILSYSSTSSDSTRTPPSTSATTSTDSTHKQNSTPPSTSATTSTDSTRMPPSTSATNSTDSTRTPPSISATTSTDSTHEKFQSDPTTMHIIYWFLGVSVLMNILQLWLFLCKKTGNNEKKLKTGQSERSENSYNEHRTCRRGLLEENQDATQENATLQVSTV